MGYGTLKPVIHKHRSFSDDCILYLFILHSMHDFFCLRLYLAVNPTCAEASPGALH